MTMHIADLFPQLQHDTWRAAIDFSPDLKAAQEAMFAAETQDALAASLGAWIGKHQPCLFGKVAARRNTIEYCVLASDDLSQSDEHIARRIQTARRSWKARALHGDASAFIVAAIAPQLTVAIPDETVLAIASRLCQLYLILESVSTDIIYTDSLDLDIPARGGKTLPLTFDVGVNYFASHADGRWWHDHRIPGGIALSMNSVGHLVRSAQLENTLSDTERLFLEEMAEHNALPLDSLPEALRWAMQTIAGASDAVSGRATTLLPLPPGPTTPARPSCPKALPNSLAGKDHCSYFGHYHTDVTLPSEFFRSDVQRPAGLPGHRLDFTYIFDDRLDNPAFARMGRGVQTRSVSVPSRAEVQLGSPAPEAVRKRGRAKGRTA